MRTFIALLPILIFLLLLDVMLTLRTHGRLRFASETGTPGHGKTGFLVLIGLALICNAIYLWAINDSVLMLLTALFSILGVAWLLYKANTGWADRV